MDCDIIENSQCLLCFCRFDLILLFGFIYLVFIKKLYTSDDLININSFDSPSNQHLPDYFQENHHSPLQQQSLQIQKLDYSNNFSYNSSDNNVEKMDSINSLSSSYSLASSNTNSTNFDATSSDSFGPLSLQSTSSSGTRRLIKPDIDLHFIIHSSDDEDIDVNIKDNYDDEKTVKVFNDDSNNNYYLNNVNTIKYRKQGRTDNNNIDDRNNIENLITTKTNYNVNEDVNMDINEDKSKECDDATFNDNCSNNCKDDNNYEDDHFDTDEKDENNRERSKKYNYDEKLFYNSEPIIQKTMGVKYSHDLSLTFKELKNIRKALARAEIESIPFSSSMREDVYKGKICYVCLKTRFRFFGPWSICCRLCERCVCTRCSAIVSIERNNISKIPIQLLVPNALQTSSLSSHIFHKSIETREMLSIPDILINSKNNCKERLARSLSFCDSKSSLDNGNTLMKIKLCKECELFFINILTYD